MLEKNYVSSTIQFDKNLYKQMKVRTALLDMTLKEFVNNAVVELLKKEKYQEHCIDDFNKETRRAMSDSANKQSKPTTFNSVAEMFKSMGIKTKKKKST